LSPGALLSGSNKLLAINRGESDPDDRDSLANKKVYTTGDLIGERVKIDAGKTARTLMRKLAKRKSLKNLPANFLKPYAEGQLIGNPLSAPIEETNPLQILEQQYRITSMGPGGIGSESAVTEEAQNVHTSEFGFIDPVQGPESSRAGIDVRATHNARLGSDGRIYQRFYSPRLDRYEWLSPRDLRGKSLVFND
jgi:DNA-directed RNA polymerase beta subunit